MTTRPIAILFSKHSVVRLKERIPGGHGLIKGSFVRLVQVREQDQKRKAQWMLPVPNGVLLGRLLQKKTKSKKDVFIVTTVLDAVLMHKQQRTARRQFIPLDVMLFQITAIGTTYRREGRMPTVREQVSELLKRNSEADYWEKLVLRLAEVLLAEVDEQLRGIPVEEAGLEKWTLEDYMNLPEGTMEMTDGIPSTRRWMLAVEGRWRRGYRSLGEEIDAASGKQREELEAIWAAERAALRAKPFHPSQIPFSGGPPEEEE